MYTAHNSSRNRLEEGQSSPTFQLNTYLRAWQGQVVDNGKQVFLDQEHHHRFAGYEFFFTNTPTEPQVKSPQKRLRLLRTPP